MADNIFKLPVQRRDFTVVPDSINEDRKTVDVVWSTGAKARQYDWRSDTFYWEELEISEEAIKLDRLNAGASVLDSHGDWSIRGIIGVVEKSWIEDGKAYARLLIDDGDDEGANIWRKICDGFIRHVSCGYVILKAEKTEVDGEITIRALLWEPHEISFVAAGADPDAGVRSANKSQTYPCTLVRSNDTTQPPEGETMADEVKTEDSGNPQTPAPAAGTQEQQRSVTPEANAQPAGQAPAEQESAQRSVADTSREIMEICEIAGADLRTANDFIHRGISPETARRELLEQKAKRSEGHISTQQVDGGSFEATKIDPNAIYRNLNGGQKHG